MKGTKLTPVLIAVDALLTVVLAALWFAPGPPAHWRNWQLPAPQAPNLDDVRAAQLVPNPALRSDYPVIIERPLFTADRKPRATASDAQAATLPSDPLDQIKLYGLVDGPVSQGVLLEQNGQSQFVRRGEKIGDWTLQTIEGRDAVFVKDNERRTVPLPNSLTDAASAPASAPSNSVTVPRPVVPQSRPPVPFQPIPAPGNALRPAQHPARPSWGDSRILNQTSPAWIGTKT